MCSSTRTVGLEGFVGKVPALLTASSFCHWRLSLRALQRANCAAGSIWLASPLSSLSMGVAYQFHAGRLMGVHAITGLTDEAFPNRSHCPFPPLPEQAAIVRYLDYVDRRIRRYVSRQAEAHCAAGGGEAGHRQPGRHPRPQPQRRPQALRRRVAGRRARALGGHPR